MTSRARSSVTRPLPVIAVTSSTRERIFDSTSTAAIATGGSSDRLSDTSLRSSCFGPKLAMPRSITLVATPLVAEQVQHRVGQEPRLHRRGSLPLAEVGGQLQARLIHSCSAIHCPSSAAPNPSTTLTTILATAGRTCRSSLSRWVSSIQVENVV